MYFYCADEKARSTKQVCVFYSRRHLTWHSFSHRHAQALRDRASPLLTAPRQTPKIPSLDCVASTRVIRAVLVEWFELYHPACPIMHRATLLSRLDAGDALHDMSFFCLVTSVVCSTIGNLRHAGQQRYPEITLKKCEDALERVDFFNTAKASMSLERCITLYHMSYSHYFYSGMDDPTSFRYMQEATSIMRWIIAYELRHMTEFKAIQLTKRTFWLVWSYNWCLQILLVWACNTADPK